MPGGGSLGRLGDFDLLRELGRGGMGVVYEARQISLNRRVALKVLPPGLGLTDQAVKRFGREARAAAKLHHTNIVPVHAIGEADGNHFYAMELIEGQPLSDVLRDLRSAGANPLLEETVTMLAGNEQSTDKPTASSTDPGITSLSDTQSGSRKWFDVVAKLIADVADALEYAHRRGVIHRDVKPANLMLSREGRLCVTDFGLARVAQEPGMTVSGSLLGTPAYMSPEQITAGRVKLDHRTDVYSLGAVLYELLAQRRPFAGKTREEVLSQILTKDPPAPRRFNARVPLDLETIALKALEKDPDRRYATAGELAHDLRQYLQGGLIRARRAGPLRRAWKAMRRHPVATTVAVAVLVIGLLVGFGWGTVTRLRVARLVSEAKLVTERGEYRKGLGLAEEALRLDPDNVEARLRRARTLVLAQRFVDAAEEAQAVLRVDPENWAAHVVMVRAAACCVPSIDAEAHRAAVERLAPETADAFYMRAGAAESDRESIEWLDRALELDPGHVLAIWSRSTDHAGLKDLPAALADAERMQAVRPRSALGHILVSNVRLNLHDVAGAIAAADRAVELAPEEPYGYYIRGAVHAVMGRWDEAIADSTRAVELDPEHPRYLHSRGSQHLRHDDSEKAAADLERALKLNPDYVPVSSALAMAYWNLDRKEEARELMDVLADRAATWHHKRYAAGALAEVARFHLRSGEHEIALESAEESLGYAETLVGHQRVVEARLRLGRDIDEACDRMDAMELDNPGAFYQRGNYMLACRRDDQALADYSRAIELAPNWAAPFVERARLYRNRFDDEERTLEDLDRAVELAPSWDRPLNERVPFLFVRERYEEALADLERLAELDGNFPRWRRGLQARTLSYLGRDAEALAVFDRHLDENPRDADAMRGKAETLFYLGRTEQAVAALDEAIETDPTEPLFYLNRAQYAVFLTGGCARAEGDLARFKELSPDEADTWDDLACTHVESYPAACPDLANATAALDLARRAVAADENDAGFRLHLGMAAYRAGDYRTARDALRKGIEESRVVYAPTMFFMAMTLHRLGDRAGARDWYERGVARMERAFPDHPLVVSIRLEAAELLNVAP